MRVQIVVLGYARLLTSADEGLVERSVVSIEANYRIYWESSQKAWLTAHQQPFRPCLVVQNRRHAHCRPE